MESRYRVDDLIQAPATPRGRSAVAVVRTSGPGCIAALAQRFSRPKAMLQSEGYRVHHGWIVDGGERIDEVLVTVFREPASYTGQDSAEISCHGGPVVVDRIQDVLRRSGFRDAEPGEFSFRAFSLGKMDLTRAEAVKEIIEARTDRARALASSRLAGSVKSVVDDAKAVVTRQSAVAALALDYPEDEAEPVPLDRRALAAARKSLQALIRTWRTGRIFHDGLKVALAGPANAGKSSLFNLFLKEERSIVTETPGTTRDWVEAWLNLDGIPLQLVDTAGLRGDTGDPIEQEGIRRTRNLIAGADVVVAVADGTAGAGAAEDLERRELQVLGDAGKSGGSAGADHSSDTRGSAKLDDVHAADGRLPVEHRLVRVWNKADLAPEAPEGWIPVSALTGLGFPELEEALRSRALPEGRPPEAGAAVIDSERQRRLLERAVAALDQFEAGSAEGRPADLLAEDLRDALDALGELTGEVSRTDVLDLMFGSFCVGK